MIADKQKVQIAMARACMKPSDIAKKAQIPAQTVKNAICGIRSVSPATMGKVARALNVDVTEILLDEEGNQDE